MLWLIQKFYRVGGYYAMLHQEYYNKKREGVTEYPTPYNAVQMCCG